MDLWSQDPEVAAAIAAETIRQETGLEMIASENYVSEAVLQAQGSVFTNKYAEGYPGRRYYGGCENADVVEELARQRAIALFGAERANVQPHSGAQANMAVYLAALAPGERLLGMDLSCGGHLTHGAKVNSSGVLYDAATYRVDDAGWLDLDAVRKAALAHRPKLLVCGASAYPRAIDFAAFKAIADEVGALLMADIAHVAGLVAHGLHPDPVPHCDFVTTTTHKTLRGPRGGLVLCKADWIKQVNSAVFPRMQGGPLMHVVAAKAVALGEASTEAFAAYARQVVANARALAEALQAGGVELVTGGTDNHLVLVSLLGKELTGAAAEAALGRAHITVNKNTVPGETRSPMVTSGLRIGTPALTARGMGPGELRVIGDWIARILAAPDDEGVLGAARAAVHELCAGFPIYPERLAAAQAGRG